MVSGIAPTAQRVSRPRVGGGAAKRPADLAVAHVLSNMLADMDAADRVSVTGLMTIFTRESRQTVAAAAPFGPDTR